MDKPPFEVADVIRALADAESVVPGLCLSTAQRRVLSAIATCRTAKLGGHVEECDAGCGHELIAYNSCGNRHCPKCQARSRAEWLEARREELLPVAYFHVVFTLPGLVGPLGLHNRREIYNLLFSAAGDTLKEIAQNPKHLGAEVGFIAVLHTWGQTLVHHPPVHCVVPGGGLADDGQRWVASREDFFLSVRVLSRLFRGKFIAGLRHLFAEGRLCFGGDLVELSQPDRFDLFCGKLREQEWVVYAKPPFGGPEQVLKYVARYTHRVAIANRRILNIDADSVSFSYKDYRQGNQRRVMSLSSLEFLRRFVQHILPDGFVRIRHFGFLANRCRKKKLDRCRQLLCGPEAQRIACQPDSDAPTPAADDVPIQHLGDEDHEKDAVDSDGTTPQADPHRCPKCGKGKMRPTATFDPQFTWTYERRQPAPRDTS